MNPTFNQKEFDELTTNLRDLAYSYLEKYSPSKQQLKIYLLKKYLKKFSKLKERKNISEIIEKIVTNLENNKFINDELYSDSKARSMLKKGYSLNKINQSLRIKGIDQKYISSSLSKIKKDQIEPDFVSALKLCKKRRIGAIRPSANREIFYKKDMGILARAGFSFEISKKILELEKNEFEKLIKII